VQYPMGSTDKTNSAKNVKVPERSGKYYDEFENYSRQTLIAHLKAHRSWERWAKASIRSLSEEVEQYKMTIMKLEQCLDRENG
jgi:hypothetical protein